MNENGRAHQPVELWLIDGEPTLVTIGERITTDARLAERRAQQAEAEADERREKLDQPPKGAPKPGSDLDTWLAWREREKRRGAWYRLKQIARWSGYTIDQVKYKSLLRKPRGTPKTPPKKSKKVEKKWNE